MATLADGCPAGANLVRQRLSSGPGWGPHAPAASPGGGRVPSGDCAVQGAAAATPSASERPSCRLPVVAVGAEEVQDGAGQAAKCLFGREQVGELERDDAVPDRPELPGELEGVGWVEPAGGDASLHARDE